MKIRLCKQPTQLNDHISPFYSAIEKNSNNVVGKDVKMLIIRPNGESVVACSEDAELPTPYKNRYLDITMPLKNIYGSIEVSDKALRVSRDSSGSFINLVNAEMEGLIASAKFNFQRMLYGNGNGALTAISGADSNAATNFKYYLYGIDYLRQGMQVDVTTKDGVKTEKLTIMEINVPNQYIIFDKKVEGSPTDAVLTHPGAYGNELTGLGAIFGDDAELYGHDRKAEPYFDSYYKHDALNESTLAEIIDHMEEEYNSKINMILCSYETRRNIAKLFAGLKFTMNTVDANGGFGTVTVNGIPVYADKFCPEGVVYFLNTDDFVLTQLCDWEWLEDEDGKILKQVPGKAAYGATLVKYAELICKKPCGQAMLKIR